MKYFLSGFFLLLSLCSLVGGILICVFLTYYLLIGIGLAFFGTVIFGVIGVNFIRKLSDDYENPNDDIYPGIMD